MMLIWRILRWLPALIWMGIIFMLSHQSGEQLQTWMPFFQRWFPFMQSFDWGHFVAFFVLALTVFIGFGSKKMTFKIIVVIVCLTFGVTDEFHQSFVSGRTPDVKDVRNDTIGAIVAMIFVSLPPVRNWLEKKLIK